MTKNWYAVYTKPRWEKKVADMLTARNVTNYCPLNKVIRQWSDRKKTIYQPLFTSYVFVQAFENQLSPLHEVPGVLSLVHWLRRPAIIKNEEIESIRQFLHEHENVCLTTTNIAIHDRIMITEGPLIHHQGAVIAIDNNFMKVALPSLGILMYAKLRKTSVTKL